MPGAASSTIAGEGPRAKAAAGAEPTPSRRLSRRCAGSGGLHGRHPLSCPRAPDVGRRAERPAVAVRRTWLTIVRGCDGIPMAAVQGGRSAVGSDPTTVGRRASAAPGPRPSGLLPKRPLRLAGNPCPAAGPAWFCAMHGGSAVQRTRAHDVDGPRCSLRSDGFVEGQPAATPQRGCGWRNTAGRGLRAPDAVWRISSRQGHPTRSDVPTWRTLALVRLPSRHR
jgi:hypothetical protein